MALSSAYAGRRVFVTGHTGFKGSWLSLWLARMGAQVHGLAFAPCSSHDLFEAANIRGTLQHHLIADVRDAGHVASAIAAARPEILFHLAAQPLVRAGYADPLATWSTNVMGTVNVLEAVRACESVKAVVIVTTDKCYENREWHWGYRESDPLGGHDPYSASKAAAELVAASYRSSFFTDGRALIATARAGNVIGGGDWSPDRLIPDAARAVAAGRVLSIRNPDATRPWQHVLESLHGYLLLGAKLLAGEGRFACAFNFGPGAEDNVSVGDVLTMLGSHWPSLRWTAPESAPQAEPSAHEARYLYLDASMARRELGWQPRWRLDRALQLTAQWYDLAHGNPARVRDITETQIAMFESGEPGHSR